MEELKNNIANVTTIVGTGSVVMGASDTNFSTTNNWNLI